jgi:hypothetical protein
MARHPSSYYHPYRTLRAIHQHVGGKVKVRGPNGTHDFRVVGRIAFPTVAEPQPLADGASFTASGLAPMIQKSHCDRSDGQSTSVVSAGNTFDTLESRYSPYVPVSS